MGRKRWRCCQSGGRTFYRSHDPHRPHLLPLQAPAGEAEVGGARGAGGSEGRRSLILRKLRTGAHFQAGAPAASPSWFLRITCDRCGKDRMLNEVHMSAPQRGMVLRVLIGRMRHDGCGGRAGGWNC
jgi:hypothetical protein